MPQKDSPDYRAEAQERWKQLYHNQAYPEQDSKALRQLLKETQIAELALLLENEELKKYQDQALDSNLNTLQSLVGALPNTLFIKDIQNDYHILYWSVYASQLLGATSRDGVGKTDEALFSFEKSQAIRREDEAAVAYSLEHKRTFVRHNGRHSLLYRNVIKDAHGAPRFLIGCLKDHRQLEASLLIDQTLKTVVEDSEEAIVLFVDGAFFDCNQRALDLYQVADKLHMAALRLSDVSPVYQPNGKASEKQVLAHLKTLKKESICRFYWLHSRPDGTTFHADVVVSIIPYKNEEIVRVVVRDISEQIRQQSEMRKLSFMVQKTDNTVAILNDQALIEWVNEGFEKMTGYQPDAAIGQHFGDLLEAGASKGQFQLPSPDSDAAQQGLLYELEGQRKDGRRYWRLTSVTPFMDVAGALKYLVIESDLTKQRQSMGTLPANDLLIKALDEAAQHRQRLEAVEHLVKVGYWSSHVQPQTTYWSEELYHILGYDVGAIPPQRAVLLERVHPEDVGRLHQAHQQLLEDQQPYRVSYRIRLKEGTIAFLYERCAGEFDEQGALVSLSGTIQDITEQQEQEVALRNSLKKVQDLQYALDQSSMVVVVDAQHRILSANELFCKTTHYQEYELLGQSFKIIDPKHHSRWFLQQMWDTVKEGAVWKGELKNRTKIGTPYWTDTAIVPFLGKDGTPYQYVVLQHDISSKKNLEETLEDNNEAEFAKLYHQQQQYLAEIEERSAEWERFFKLSTEMISVVAIDGTIVRTNPAFIRALGFNPHELIGHRVTEFIHEEDLAEAKTLVKRLQAGMDVMGYENRWRNHQGEYRWMSWRAVMDRETQLTYSISRDITEEKIAQQKIQDLTHTLHQTTIVVILDKDEQIASVNNKFCEVSGYSSAEVVGSPYQSIQSRYHDRIFWLKLRNTIRAGKIWQGEICEQTKLGQHYWTHTSIVPFINNTGEPSHYIVTQSDITDRKNLEEKLREAKKEADKNAKIKEDFLANMSHEIRTPMNGVLGFSRLLLQTEMTDIQHEYAQSIYSSAENLLVIVNDILDVSKIESGTFQLHEVPFNLKKRIEEGLSILKVSVQKKNLEFIINIDPNIPTIITGVPDRLSQILINLVGNAIKFTKKGQIELNVQQKNKYLIFEVRDTGIGIPANKLDTIFDSFTQAENYTTREYSGTGLGLSISRKLVNVMGGQIGVESTLGEGSTFYFTLPYKEATDAQSSALNTKGIDEEAINDATPLILIVEDNTVNQELTQIYLNLLDSQYHVAYNGAEAVEKVKQYNYDLILMDIQMPKMDGMAATTAIRAFNEQVPIVAMSAHALERERERCFEIGMNDYISKPFKVEALRHILEKYITLSKERQHTATPRVQHLNTQALQQELAKNRFLKQADASISRELLQLFKNELTEVRTNMDSALAQKDVHKVQRVMHKIKSNFQWLDLPQFYTWSDAIDRLATEEAPIDDIEQVYQKFKEALPALVRQIEQELHG